MAPSGRSRTSKRSVGPERRRQIAEAVIALADKFGVHGVTTAKIAAEVGVSEPALYIYFKSRDLMLREAIDVMYERNITEMTDHSTAENMVEHFLRMSTLFTSDKEPGRQRAMRIKLQLLAAPLSAGLRERMVLGEAKQIDAHVRMVEQGKAEGSIRQDVDSRELVWDLYHAYSAEGLPAHVLGLRDDTRTALETPIARVLRSAAADPSQVERYLERLQQERLG